MSQQLLEESIVQLSAFKRLICMLKFKKGCFPAIFCYISLLLICFFIISWPLVVATLYLAGDSIYTIIGISLLFVAGAVVWSMLLRVLLSHYFKTSNRSASVSFRNQTVSTSLTPEAIQFYEDIVASKDGIVTPQGNDLYDISVPTNFLTVT